MSPEIIWHILGSPSFVSWSVPVYRDLENVDGIVRPCMLRSRTWTWKNCTYCETALLGIFFHVRFSICSLKCIKSDNPHTHKYTHIKGSKGSNRSSSELVSKVGDKRARAHCPSIRDEQRCENVTTNSSWSPNVTFPLQPTSLPSSYSVLGSLLSNPPLLLYPSTHDFHHTLLFPSLFPLLLPSHPSTPLSFSSPQKGREGKRTE